MSWHRYSLISNHATVNLKKNNYSTYEVNGY